MCGIAGYFGENDAPDRVYESLKKLEYRGYDSCGISSIVDGEFKTSKAIGPPSELLNKIEVESRLSIGHTRWATHGKVTIENAHPHISQCGTLALVHNGVIENSEEIKDFLTKEKNVEFQSETDSEVLCNLISHYHCNSFHRCVTGGKMSLLDSVRRALTNVEGTYGILVLSLSEPDTVVAAKRSSPLILGVGDGEMYFASDANALPPNIDKVVYLEDDQITQMVNGDWQIFNMDSPSPLDSFKRIKKIKSRKVNTSLGAYSCYMEREIFEQPTSIRNAMRGRFSDDFSSIKFGGIDTDNRQIDSVLFLGCGTAYHAGLLGKYFVENISRIPASVEYSSEFKYKNTPCNPNTLVVGVSQSGETLDTLGALQEARKRNLDTVAITNVVASSIARQVGEGIYQYAGPEISVASTKAFTSQSTILLMIAVLLGRKNALSAIDAKRYISNIRKLPELVSQTTQDCKDVVRALASKFSLCSKIDFLGRQYLYPIALEGALKTKELSYIHAHGYPAGEMKHGPLATVGAGHLCFYLATQESLRDKNISNMKELKARECHVVAVAQKGQSLPKDCYDYLIEIPRAEEYLSPILSTIPLQLFSMYLAQKKNYNVDRPRHLAKSVTVE
jgi:glucosamine--fructose-6-phosphate aminotransferase (isomerizing)